MKIRPAVTTDSDQLAAIYNHYIASTCTTFEIDEISTAEMRQRVSKTLKIPLPWLVAESLGDVLGYAYAAPWKERHAYRFTVESTIYLRDDQVGKGVGLPLYSALVEAVRALSLHSMMGGIALPNKPSIRLHERLGFTKTGQFEQVGFKQGRWVDVGYWQLLL